MNKISMEEVKLLKPSIIAPICSSIGCIVLLIGGVVSNIWNNKLCIVLTVVMGICAIVLWKTYVDAYKNYRDACQKVKSESVGDSANNER